MRNVGYKYEYTDQTTDRQNILDSHKDLILIEEQNITEGNFLIFTDIKPQGRDDIKNKDSKIYYPILIS